MTNIKFLVMLLVIAWLLSGCSSAPVVTQIPVSTPCSVEMPVKPGLSYAPGTYSSLLPAVKDLKSDRDLLQAYGIELEAAVKYCKGIK